jgi:hypothetical protein
LNESLQFDFLNSDNIIRSTTKSRIYMSILFSKFFGYSYTIRIKVDDRIGYFRKTIGIDMEPLRFIFKYKDSKFNNNENFFNLINIGVKEFILDWDHEYLQINEYRMIEIDIMAIEFKYEIFQINLSVHKWSNFKFIKQIILKKVELDNVWLMFCLIDEKFNDSCKSVKFLMKLVWLKRFYSM